MNRLIPTYARTLPALVPGLLAGLLVCGAGAAGAQSVSLHAPAASSSGFALPRASGTVTYSVALSEGLSFGYNGSSSNTSSTNVSGHIGYLSSSEKQPFSLVYSGAFLGGVQGQPSSFVHNLGLSQVFTYHRLGIVLADAVSYLPQGPVTGLSGVPGLGDQGLAPVQAGQDDGAQLLSQYSPRITNTASASVNYQFTGVTSLAGSGTDGIIRTTGTGGIESDSQTGGLGLTHRLNALASIGVNGSYQHFSYLAYPLTYNTIGGTVEYTRKWSRTLRTDFAVGPDYSTSTNVASTLNYSLNASATYLLRRATLGASVVRATNSGSGVTLASRSTSANLIANRMLGPFSSVAATVSYTNNVTLPTLLLPQFSTSALVAGGQVTRSLTRSISAFASYTLQRQLLGQDAFQNGFQGNAFNGTTQSLGFGITYAPRPLILGSSR